MSGCGTVSLAEENHLASDRFVVLLQKSGPKLTWTGCSLFVQR